MAYFYCRCFGTAVGRTLESTILDMPLMLLFDMKFKENIGNFSLTIQACFTAWKQTNIKDRRRTHSYSDLHKIFCTFGILNVVLEGKQLDYICSIQFIYRVIRNDCQGFNNLSYTVHLR